MKTMSVQTLFQLGMKRTVMPLYIQPLGPILNLGCGNRKITGAINIDYPEWNAEQYVIEIPLREARRYELGAWTQVHEAMGSVMVRVPSNSIALIHAYHFLEHLADPRRMLREIQRVLMPGGVVNICVPHYWGSMAHHDLDHKHTFALDTWSNTFNANYEKDRHGWQFKIHLNMLMAITECNVAILTQLVKDHGQRESVSTSGANGTESSK